MSEEASRSISAYVNQCRLLHEDLIREITSKVSAEFTSRLQPMQQQIEDIRHRQELTTQMLHIAFGLRTDDLSLAAQVRQEQEPLRALLHLHRSIIRWAAVAALIAMALVLYEHRDTLVQFLNRPSP